jgi:hypothetical protein
VTRLPPILVLLFSLAGCCLPSQTFVAAVDLEWKAVGPEYKSYVVADRRLSDQEKQTRLRGCKIFEDTIAEAQKAVGGPTTR